MPRKQTGKGVAGDIVNFVRANQLLSKGLGLIPHPAAQLAARVAGQLGLGRKRKAKKQSGRGIFSDLGGGIGSVFGGLGSGVGSIAHGLFGAGRKKKTLRV